MTTLFLIVTGVCQSLNELGVASVTKKWSGQNRTSRTACYGPDTFAGEAGEGERGRRSGDDWRLLLSHGPEILPVT